jgi:hypothetical protein
MFMSCASPLRNMANTTRFTSKPMLPIHNITGALTGSGESSRFTASKAIQATMNSSAQPFRNAASTRSR